MGRVTAVGVVGGLGALALAAALASCLSATEIRVTLSTNVACSSQPTEAVFLGAATLPLARSNACTAGTQNNLIGSIVVLPKVSSDERVEINVVGSIDNTISAAECANRFAAHADPSLLKPCIQARRSIAFIAHSPLDLPIVMDSACAGVVCKEGQTCVGGGCVDDHVTCDTNECASLDGGSPDASPVDAAPDVDAGTPAVPLHLFAHAQTTCVVTTSNHVQCFGSNVYGQMGIAPAPTFWDPTDVAMTSTSVGTLGETHGCAIDTNKKINCWGNDSFGQVDMMPQSAPVNPTLVGVGSLVTVGLDHSCMVDGSGTVTCWGSGQFGQLGPNNKGPGTELAPVNGTLAALSAGRLHTCALRASNGGVFCWGDDAAGQSGGYGAKGGPIVGPQAPLAGLGALSCSDDHCAAAGPNGIFWWGDNTKGSMSGDGLGKSSNSIATQFTNLKSANAISVALAHVCAIDSSGTLFCWGIDDGQLGGVPSNTGLVKVMPNVFEVATGDRHTCAIAPPPKDPTLSRRALYCWGANTSGQLGLGQGVVSEKLPTLVTLANE